jgi:TPP-dependent pyruvate/acetoin dehydrogenase alpha subunit
MRRPVFVEAKLKRWPGSHQIKPKFTTGESDVSMARRPEKITGQYANWVRSDPILLFLRTLLTENVPTQAEAEAIDEGVNDKRNAARAFAEVSPLPAAESAVRTCPPEAQKRTDLTLPAIRPFDVVARVEGL